MSTQLNIGDVWKSVSGMQINIGDTWKTVNSAQINIGDTWKTFYSSVVPNIYNQASAYWKFNSNLTEEISGITSTGYSITYGAGHTNNCAIFNGTSSRIIPSGTNYMRMNSAGTISVWLYLPSQLGTEQYTIMSCWNQGDSTLLGGYQYYLVRSSNITYVRFYGKTKAGTDGNISIVYDIPTTTWVNLVLTFDGSTSFKLYSNGSYISGATLSSSALKPALNNKPVYIGSFGSFNDILPASDLGRYFSGKLEDISYYNKELTTSEISEIFLLNLSNAIFAVDGSNSTSYPGSGTIWYDLTSNAKNLTLTNVSYDTSTKSLIYNGSTSMGKTSSVVSTAITGVSIESVFYSDDVTLGQQTIYYNGADGGSDNNGYGFFINQVPAGGTGKIWILYGGKVWYDTGYVVSSNTWYHAVFVIQLNYKPQLYINGILVYNFTGTATAPNTPTKSTGVGFGTMLVVNVIKGKIKMCSAYNLVLNADNVTYLYNKNKI